jgi:chromosome segregation ATPase
MENGKMDEMVKELEEAKAQIASLQQKLDLESKVKELESQLAEKDAVIADLEAKIAEKQTQIEEDKASIEQKEEELSAAKTEKEAVVEFLRAEVKKVLVASSSEEEVPEDLDGISKLLGEKQKILASLIPAGGVSTQIQHKSEGRHLVCGYDVEQIKAFQVKQ